MNNPSRRARANKIIGNLRQYAFEFGHWYKRKYTQVDWVMMTLPTRLPPLPVPRNMIERRILGEPPLSLAEVAQIFDAVAYDERAKGVVMYLRPFEMPLANVLTLRDHVRWLREKGKKVITFAHDYDLGTYLVASAADEIIMQRGSELRPLGLQSNVVFMKEALDAVGLKVDSEAITPYKGAADNLTRQTISVEQREQLNWLLDSLYEVHINHIAEGRGLEADAVRELVDNAPYTDSAALNAGYVDAVMNEEEIIQHIDARHPVTGEQAPRVLVQRFPGVHEKLVAVLPVGGMIIEGESMSPPNEVPLPIFGSERMGNITVSHQVRHLMQSEQVGAVVLWVDSPGGSASASEAIAATLQELAKERPLVVCMNAVAASGGYYIATPAHWIVAQPGTLTGSIGVLGMKVINSDLLKKLRFNAVEFLRGANAGFMSSTSEWNDEQREKVRANIKRIYDQFLQRVAESRDMPVDEVDGIAGGRVWTGAQALENGLVDELGGLREAVKKARELANLPDKTPAFLVRMPKTKPIVPQLAEAANPAATLHYLRDGLKLANGEALMLMPLVMDGE